jgi:putative transcriptional regulator
VTPETRETLPSPLWPYVDGDIGHVRWRRRGKGIETADVPLSRGGYSAHLLRIQPGHSVPVHTHRGTEYTLVLTGAYHDGAEHYAAGDLQVADASVNHQPVADAGEVCLCFAVLDEPLRFTGPVARYMNPFIRL